MKTLIILLFAFIQLSAVSQEIINACGSPGIYFGDTSSYKYLYIDTSNIWYITKPDKQILNWDDYAIVSDTNDYYSKNLKSSFQFKLCIKPENVFGCCAAINIGFMHRYDFEKNKDGGIIETSYDNGVSWHNILYDTILYQTTFASMGLYSFSDSIKSHNNQPGFTGTLKGSETVSVRFWCSIRDQMPSDTILFRFTISSDSISTNNEGWALGDIHIIVYDDVNVKEINNNNIVYISPNPSSDLIIINSIKETIQKIEIYTVYGTKIMERLNANSVDISKIVPGIYIAIINNKYIKKLIIE